MFQPSELCTSTIRLDHIRITESEKDRYSHETATLSLLLFGLLRQVLMNATNYISQKEQNIPLHNSNWIFFIHLSHRFNPMFSIFDNSTKILELNDLDDET